MKRIYVGNLPFSATEDEVRELFEVHGTVSAVDLINDRETGRPRGFGFVEMEDQEAEAAISTSWGSAIRLRTPWEPTSFLISSVTRLPVRRTKRWGRNSENRSGRRRPRVQR